MQTEIRLENLKTIDQLEDDRFTTCFIPEGDSLG